MSDARFMYYDNETDEYGPLTEKNYERLKAQAHAYGQLRIAMRDIHERFMKVLAAIEK